MITISILNWNKLRVCFPTFEFVKTETVLVFRSEYSTMCNVQKSCNQKHNKFKLYFSSKNSWQILNWCSAVYRNVHVKHKLYLNNRSSRKYCYDVNISRIHSNLIPNYQRTQLYILSLLSLNTAASSHSKPAYPEHHITALVPKYTIKPCNFFILRKKKVDTRVMIGNKY